MTNRGRQPNNSVWNQLANHGPKTADGLGIQGGVSTEVRADGVRRFDLTGSKGDVEALGGPTKTVYYIHGKHDEKEILKRYLAANDGRLKCSDYVLHRKIAAKGQAWKEASRDVLNGPLGHNNTGGAKPKGGTCPMCGEEYTRDLPDHLPECDA